MTNSVSIHLTAASKAATLISMRSARKEILLVVEGDDDVLLMSNCLGLPRSNILVCEGKETLMELFSLGPQKGSDEGTVFIRDRDHDHLRTHIDQTRLLLVTEHYDVELDLLASRLFRRMFNEFAQLPDDDTKYLTVWKAICSAAAPLGSLRRISAERSLNLDFKEINLRKFVNFRNLEVDVKELVKYTETRSLKTLDRPLVVKDIAGLMADIGDQLLCRGKDVISLMHLAFSRTYKLCKSSEAEPSVLARMVRVSCTVEDFARLTLYSSFKSFVLASPYSWTGRNLP